ncbi:MAG: phosphohistidine phosphatase SixA [Gemmataceae bacterium]|nr:phosphohistidine phosphatase SixA [Gemmataceae bacterium]
MELFLIRHADAAPLGERGVTDDADRPLTAKGEAQAASIGKALQRRGIVLDKLIASPLLRAQQTANIMVRHLQPAPEVTTSEALAPGVKPRKTAKLLRSVDGERIGLVGHMPDVAEWAGWLIGAKKAEIDVAKAGIVCIECGELPNKGMGTLRWLVTPEWYS